MDLKKLSSGCFKSLCVLFVGIYSVNCQTTSNSNISIQGALEKDIALSVYLDTQKIDLIVMEAPFYMLEIAKVFNDLSIIDTFDAMSPICYQLFLDLKSNFDVYGNYQPAYRDTFFNKKFGETKLDILKSTDGQCSTESQADSLTSPFQELLSDVQLDFLRYNCLENSKRKSYWLYSEYAKSKKILFLSPHSGNPHYEEEYYLLPTPCDYFIFINESQRRKELIRVCKEFRVKSNQLKKSNYKVLLENGMLQIIFVK